MIIIILSVCTNLFIDIRLEIEPGPFQIYGYIKSDKGEPGSRFESTAFQLKGGIKLCGKKFVV